MIELTMKVKGKEKLNYPQKGWQILSAMFSMVFHYNTLGLGATFSC